MEFRVLGDRGLSLLLLFRLPLQNLITKRYSLDQVNEALDDLEQRRSLRPLIEINPALR